MSYWITKFRDVTLPTRALRQEVGVGPAYGNVRTLSGGGFDPQGTRPARRAPWRISVEGVVTADSDAALVAACGSVRALLGLAGTLYRTPDGGTANSQWAWARCVNITAGRQPPDRYHCPMQLTFEVQSPAWRGTALKSTSHAISADTNTSAGFVNAGNAAIYDATLRFKATGAASGFSVRGTASGYETHVQYIGDIPTNGTLEIDAEDLTVTLNGTPAFAGFTYGTYAERQEWFILNAATTTLTVRADDAGGTVTITYYDAYA